MTTSVECYFVTPAGDPLVNARVEIQPAKSGFQEAMEGIVMPRLLRTTTDGSGRCTLELWPSSEPYYVTCRDPSSKAGLSYKFMVPVDSGPTLFLQDLVIEEGTISDTEWDTEAVALILDAKANAIAAAAAAEEAAATAGIANASVNGSGNLIITKLDGTILDAGHVKGDPGDGTGGGGPVVDDLTSGGSTAALSAEQGVVLKQLVDAKADPADIPALINNLTTGNTTAALTAQQGLILKGLVDSLNTAVSLKANASAVHALQAGSLVPSTTKGASPTAVIDYLNVTIAALYTELVALIGDGGGSGTGTYVFGDYFAGDYTA